MAKTKVTFDSDRLDYASELMRALAHPLRLRIIAFIDRYDAIQVNKIYNTLKIEQSITSQHLKILRLAGVVTASRDGKFMKYSLDYDCLERASKAVSKFAASESSSRAMA